MVTTPLQYGEAEKTLSTFLGHTGVGEGEIYRVLRALEVATIKDLSGKKTKITDENTLFYRTALQNQRDACERDLREFIVESMDEILAADRQKNAEFNWKMFQEMVFQTVFAHLELQFGELWNKQNHKFKVMISNEVAVIILALLRKDKNIINQIINGLGKDEQGFISNLFATNFKIADSESSLISISTPIISEIIFKKKMNAT